MKKITTLICLSLATILNAQTLKVYKTSPTCVPTLTVLNGSTIVETTTSSGTTNTRIMFKNTSTQTHTYTVYRTILFNNPLLDNTCASVNPNTAFTFGFTFFPDCINTPGPSDYTELGPAGSTSSPYDNSCNNGNPFNAYLFEGSSIGQYLVRYKLQNIANANDTLSFSINYNGALGLYDDHHATISVSVYPVPTENKATIIFDLKKEKEISIKIHNENGLLVFSTISRKYPEGKQTESIDLSKFNSGLYFVSIVEGDKVLSKKTLVKN